MLYPLMRSTISHFNPSLVSRTFSQVRMGAIGTLVFNYMFQEYSIAKQNRSGVVKPTVMHLELTTYCNWGCPRCYIEKEERKSKETIDSQTAHQAVQKGISWGIRIYNLIGGEPVSEDTLQIIGDMLTENPRLNFHCCTNGDLLSSSNEKLDELVLKNNFNIGLSIDGFEDTNDTIRTRYSFDKVMSAAEYLSSKRCFFGAVATIWPENSEEVTSEQFIDFLIDNGFVYVFYSIPLGIDQSVLADALNRLKLLKPKPIFFYVEKFGHVDDFARLKSNRSVYVKNDGIVLNDRKERIPIGSIDCDLEYLISHQDWQRRFSV